MVLGGQPPGRVGRRRIFFPKGRESGLSSFYDPGVELRDEVILLRAPVEDDAGAVAAACADGEIGRFIPLIPTPYTRADAEAWIRRSTEARAAGTSHPFAIVDGATGELLGSIEMRPENGMIGYWIAAAARGHGVATRALRLVCDWRRERPLRLMTHPDNVASQRVAEKAGFRRIGLRPHEPAFRDGTADAVLFQLD